ncbi:type I DNA topoisomerase [Rhizobium pusense]|jgi:DNA topoisomerase-1|uniref:DNA topoisomerase 1 n=1 Tax=Agrobacterium genomosp. 2 str. CFBP 5494 TaxID=1183436 RepID=A0A9W5AXY7_9HYPH|nr:MULTISPECIES: type I DNA topoisomerase [Rhizobium/Agrobacterium group]AUC09554.1 DNA topoisomerase I [Rhizobium sp. Y9]MDP9776079.1 DNA topoisomerase-1 [Rhizobium sp. SORGH_AS_0755]OAI90010.1 DNA topoisomerase I [Rhizobium sp. GHKF11]TGR67027.1 type I DNA topoisomerase [bacterium M00.F.Ca.ET.194.01.1.1]TGS53574.1 type I DNA topoisomerase [bacterium M00.F.Ca.ET.179.01.1.1]TGV46334.1 type I DNA topoisomerase [bacterium M00.F.Ca.ET.168.01.1.1]
MNVVVVESPAKAKTINKYLGSGYKVLASFGHVRDLPAKDGSVLPDQDFEMSWEVDSASAKRMKDIADAVKSSDGLFLATDPDREGEAISWHVLDLLKKKRVLGDKPVKRVVFNAITKKAVLDAMANPRDIDVPLVDAYLARRALDYLVGFNLSPVLWRKLPGARSAGRVQSVALRLVCDRESEIERFVSEEYWNISALLKTPRGDEFEARLVSADGKRLQNRAIKTGDDANRLKALLEGATYVVDSVEAKPVKRNPSPPFTTSTLQQAASSRMGFGASRTMQVAQKLYEGIDIGGETVGLITYMRTDGVQMAPEAIDAARKAIGEQFGGRYVPEKARFYSTKAKNAQEAHEAIRPTDFNRTPDQVKRYLDADQLRLYELIWKRGIASQMASAEIERTTVEILASNGGEKAGLRAVGSVIRFDGFIAAYTDQKEDGEQSDDGDDEGRLPPINERENLAKQKINASQHFTEPPPRYSEASLIKKMEELGIGRPSTYAATLKTLSDREYIVIDKRKLVPHSRGRLVTAFLESFFTKYVEYDFTAALEEKLDRISAGELDWKQVLRDFWKDFFAQIEDTKELRVTNVLDALNEVLAPLVFPKREDGSDPRICQVCGTGNLSLKLGKYGAFVGCSNYPECNYTRQLTSDGAEAEAAALNEPKALGADPMTGEELTLRSGRFGPYIQRGDGKEAKRSSLPKGWKPEDIDHEKALALINLPRDIGKHPETGKMISAGLGRYGPFLLHDGSYANLESIEDVFSIGLNRAVTVIAEKQSKGPGRGRSGTPAALKELGDHPDGGPITVRDGRYGAYVNWGKVNATIPKGQDPASVTLDEALVLIAERIAKTGTGGKPAKAKKTTAKKADGDAAAKPKATKAKAATKSKTAAKPKAAAKPKKAAE